MNVMRWADGNLKTLGDFDAFAVGSRVWTSKGAHDQVARLASGLVAMGVAPGDRVLVWLPNGPELAIAWRAVLRAGAVTVVAHYDSPRRRVEQLASETAPVSLVTTIARASLQIAAPTVRHRLCALPEVDGVSGRAPLGWVDVRHVIVEHPPLAEPIPRSDEDVATIWYTSGTTGAPKGFVTRHEALAARIRRRRTDTSPGQPFVRHLAVLPMSSGFGSGPLFYGLKHACTVHVLDRFDPERFLQAVQQHRIERTSIVPAMCEALLAVPNSSRYDISSLRRVIVGGAHVSAALIERFARVYGIRLTVQYGLSGIGLVSRSSASSPPGSSGRVSTGIEAKVVHRDGRTLGVGRTGALVLRRQTGAASELWSLHSPPIPAADSGGWFRTGDLAHFDPDGELYVVGRTDDLIIQGGYNIVGQEVAEIISGLPAVRECAVVGVPSEYLGEEAVACVALRSRTRLTSMEVISHCREHLDPRGVPTTVLFVEALPRSEAGKVRNHDLRATIQAARAAVRETELVRRLSAAPTLERTALLREEMYGLLERVLGDAVASQSGCGTTFVDMGLDSLGSVEFAEAISEAVGRRVPATLTYSHPTIDATCGFLLDLLELPSPGSAICPDVREALHEGAEELRLEDVLSAVDFASVRRSTAGRDLPRDARVVFLTGANGFLGRFLVEEFLQKLPADGRLYCLVRAPSDASAFDRLRAAYGSDPSLQDRFDRLAAGGGLTVLGGDLTRWRFSLPEATYARLCEEVDCVVHNGAVVNHLLEYRELFAPNVLGTAEIVRFAVARRIKAINYVSTAAVLRTPQRSAGYAFSKWMSEKVLRDLHDRLGVPVRIYRPGWIMAHSRYVGQINARDTFTRLLQGIVTTSIAPRSFYAEGRSTEGAYYDGLPVDVVARSVASLAMAAIDRAGYVEYQIANAHHDVSLDVIVDWVRSAGYRVDQIEDYAAWYRLFRDRLGSLERSVRRLSLLPLFHTWERPRRGGRIDADTSCFDRHLAEASRLERTGQLAPVSHITEALVHKGLSDMRALGLIDEPGDVRRFTA